MSTFSDELSKRPDWPVTSRMGIDDRTPDLKRTPFGTIDYDFYIRRAHRLRAEAARDVFGRIGKALRNLFSVSRSHRQPTGDDWAHPA